MQSVWPADNPAAFFGNLVTGTKQHKLKTLISSSQLPGALEAEKLL